MLENKKIFKYIALFLVYWVIFNIAILLIYYVFHTTIYLVLYAINEYIKLSMFFLIVPDIITFIILICSIVFFSKKIINSNIIYNCFRKETIVFDLLYSVISTLIPLLLLKNLFYTTIFRNYIFLLIKEPIWEFTFRKGIYIKYISIDYLFLVLLFAIIICSVNFYFIRKKLKKNYFLLDECEETYYDKEWNKLKYNKFIKKYFKDMFNKIFKYKKSILFVILFTIFIVFTSFYIRSKY